MVAAVNESYRAASWRRGHKLNSDKQVEVPTLVPRIKGYNYSKGDKRVKAKATYLGAQFTLNARAGAEISKRITAMKAAWSRMGKFWFSKVPARLKRLCILGYLQSSGITGLESFWTTASECRRIDKQLVKILRGHDERRR